MRFIINRSGTNRWDELQMETIVEWFMGSDPKSAEAKAIRKKVETWVSTAKHGDFFQHEAQLVLAVSFEK
jgi:hypothetical protein